MTKKIVLHRATHVGRDHLLSFVNRQDANSVFQGEISGAKTTIGIVCDGCSEGASSETGATLAANFLIREIRLLLEQGVPIAVVPNIVYARLLDFMRLTVDSYVFTDPADRVNFIKDNLLFTVVGMILTDSDLVIFVAGDGTVVVNEEINHIDSNNRPIYPAYHLVERSMLENPAALPSSFDTTVFPASLLRRAAIGSDAWKDEPDLLNQVWGFKHPAGLQRRVNQWSKTDKRFRDDVTIITVEVLEEAEGGDHASTG